MRVTARTKLTWQLFGIIALLLLALRIAGGILWEMFVVLPERDYPSKCFSCERELGKDMAWMGQPTKCFSCERDLIQRSGQVEAAFEAHPLKYY